MGELMQHVSKIEDLSNKQFAVRCFIGKSALLWATNEQLAGYALWGRPNVSDAREFCEAFKHLTVNTGLLPLMVVGDYRQLRAVEPEAFYVFSSELLRQTATIRCLEYREALLHKPGQRPAPVRSQAGPLRCHARICESVSEVATWLGSASVATYLDRANELRRQTQRVADLHIGLRQLLGREPEIGSIGEASQRLGVSSRTLQRHLRGGGSTFRIERKRARLKRAKELLKTGVRIGEIARAVGFASSQHFATWFRGLVGKAPTQWAQANLWDDLDSAPTTIAQAV